MGPVDAGSDDEVELGQVVGTFSFRGEVRLHLHNPTSDLLREVRPVILVAPDGKRRAAKMSARPGAGGRVIGRIEGVTDEAGATALRGTRVWIEKRHLPALGEDEFYVWQLVGCAVHIDGQPQGEVVAVQEAGPNEVLEIVTPSGEARFVPVLKEFVTGVDVAARVVHLVSGALDDLDEPEDEDEPEEGE